jgi:hypothetical protein
MENLYMSDIRSEKELRLRIGDIVISVSSCGGNLKVGDDDPYKSFITTHEPDVTLQVHYDQIPKNKSERKIFDTGVTWSLSQGNGKYILKDYRRIAILESDFRSGRIYIKRGGRGLFPLSYPLDELLMINLLSMGRGVMIHACGVKETNKGILFVGSSGKGKSTIANLWMGKNRVSESQGKGITILSDDRIIIRKIDGRFRAYGTPWHGDARVCSPESAPLERIFFLKHDKRTIIREIPPLETTSRLIICSFPTFWDKDGMEFTLRFCAELAQEIPSYELGFVLDKSVLDLVQDE